jgi:hypothetical protein
MRHSAWKRFDYDEGESFAPPGTLRRPSSRVAKFADWIIGGAIVLCITTLLYYVYYYSWTHQRYFTSPVGPVLYYILPTVLAGLLLVSWRLEPSSRINLSLLLVSIAVSIYVVELLLAFSSFLLFRETTVKKAETAKTAKIAKEFGVDFDTRSKLEVIVDLAKQNIYAVPNISPLMLLKKQADGTRKSELTINGTEILPLGGIANRTTVFCNENGEYVTFESDEHGFHNPKGMWGARHIDIAAIGDSFTEGFCVPSEKNFVALIRKRDLVTLNLGKSGDGPLAELATLEEYLPSIKPRVVLWFYFEGNDLGDLKTEEASPLLMSYLRDNFTQGLLNQQISIDQALTVYVEMRKDAGTLNGLETYRGAATSLRTELEASAKLAHLRLRLGLNYGSSREDQEVEPDLDLFGKIMSRAKALIGTWGGTLYFVDLPAWEYYINLGASNLEAGNLEARNEVANNELKSTHDLVLRTRDLVPALVRTLGIPVIDIHPAFEVHSDPLALFVFRQRRHYTKESNRLVAEEILRSISLSN